MTLLIVALLIVVGALVIRATLVRPDQAMLAAAEDPLDPTEGCVACGHTPITVLSEGVVRCPKCGFTGGPGMANLARKEREKEVAALSPEERWTSGIRDLGEAELALLAAKGKLEAAIDLTARLHRSEAHEYLSEQREFAADALRDFENARSLVQESALKLGIGSAEPAASDLSILDREFWADFRITGPLVNEHTFTEMEKKLAEAVQLVREKLAEVGGRIMEAQERKPEGASNSGARR